MTISNTTMTPAIVVRAVRIWSGLFLLTFVTSHLTNLSFGLVSIKAMDAARPYLSGVWTGQIMGILLFASLLSHYFWACGRYMCGLLYAPIRKTLFNW